MICTNCYCLGEYHKYNTFEYYYCISCKKEIELEEVKIEVSAWDDFDLTMEFERLLRES